MIGVDKEADVNAPDVNGRTALHSAVVAWAFIRTVLDSVIKLGADPNVTDEYGCTPLLYAVEQKETNFVSALISAGADVNISRTSCGPRIPSIGGIKAWKL